MRVHGGVPGAARDAAFQIRQQVERGRRLDVALGSAFTGLSQRDRAFAHDLTYGVTRLRGRLDHLIGAHVHKGIDSLLPGVLEVLRLGAYQLLYMGSVPTYAAVSESVDRATSLAGKGAGGLVNAVLRRVGEAGYGEEHFPSFTDDPAGFLSTWGSHPGWMVARWLERWTPAEVRALVESNNRQPSVYLVPLDRTADEARVVLVEAGLHCESVADVDGCLRLNSGTPAEALDVLPCALVQDPAAYLVVRYADVPPGTKVADLCAAPGGKALVAAAGARYTLAADRSERRIRMVRENAKRTQSRIGCVVSDAAHPPFVDADVVLVDVPCTGTGTLARHPDARWRLREDSIAELAEVQRRFLDAAASSVAPGGLLVYSTCTLEPEENDETVDAFLATHPEFRSEATEAVQARFIDGRGRLAVLPHQSGFDGSFAARLRRQA